VAYFIGQFNRVAGRFLHYLPKRYAADSAIVIDSTGRTSDQMDVVIYDPQYTPTLLDQHDHKYIPAEAVYAVMEVKPTVNKSYLDYAGKKAASVRRLKRTSIPIPHAGGTYHPNDIALALTMLDFSLRSTAACRLSVLTRPTLLLGVRRSIRPFSSFYAAIRPEEKYTHTGCTFGALC